MGDCSVSVKDLILDQEDFEQLGKRKNVNRKKEYVYRVFMQSGCDFAVSRREKGKKKETRLVIIVSQDQYYIEEDGTKKPLTGKALSGFLSGMKRGEQIALPEVNWLDHLEYGRFFATRLYDCISSGLAFFSPVSCTEMMRQGDFVLHEWDYHFCRDFGERRVSIRTQYINEFAPRENEGEVFGRFGANGLLGQQDAFGAGPAGDPFGAYDPFCETDPLGLRRANRDKYLYSIRLYGGYNPSRTDGIYGGSYPSCQNKMYASSPVLYKHMLQLMSTRRGVSKKSLLINLIPDPETRESMLFQSFGAFVFIERAYGIDTAKMAMRRYLESAVSDIIPAAQMSIFLFGKNDTSKLPVYASEKDSGIVSPGRGDKVHKLEGKAFLNYLFEESVRQGYDKNMNLFLYQWGQVLYLQRIMELKRTDKYPRNLASDLVRLMSKVGDFTNRIENNLWKDAAAFLEPLEYFGEKYQIIVPRCTADLAKEGEQQSNCVKTYEQRLLDLNTRICFMRYADPKKADRSLVTIEVDNNNRVVQAKARFNARPSEEKLRFVKEWEKARGLTDATGETDLFDDDVEEDNIF